MSTFVLYGKPSTYDKTRDRVNKPHAFFYFEASDGSRYEAVINVESREGGEPGNNVLFRVLASDEGVPVKGTLFEDDTEVATKQQSDAVAALLKQVRGKVAQDEPNLKWFDNKFNYQQLWSDDEVVSNWIPHPHQGDDGLFELLQSIFDNFKAAERWFFIGKKFSQRGLDMVHMNAGVGAPDGLLLIDLGGTKWVGVFFAFQSDFYDTDSQPRPFRRHSSLTSVIITNVNYNPPGDDKGRESITLRNNGAKMDLNGWKLTAIRGGIERRYVLPPVTLPAKAELEIFVSEELFPNKGATVTLRDLSDRIVAATEYVKE